ncbi:MAG: hydantoinase/oxoprolinase family protein [Paracoccaceae bacterium]|nr:hydantoinase/oxoprolinase family protein [Paracoccaceae bacterium]
MSGWRIGADIGGTFTDLVLRDDQTGAVALEKLLTTPEQPDDAVIAGVAALVDRSGLAAAGLDALLHATTLFTNALIQRRGAKTALITTAGFEDTIEIAREHRFDMYDLRMRRPEPLAPKALRFGVVERVMPDGSVHTPLDEASLAEAVRAVRTSGAEAVGVCLLHAYANPAHEQEVAARLAADLPEVAVTLSSEVAPEIREYERTSTVLANAYVQGIAERYLDRMLSRLAELGAPERLFVMQSDGGLLTPSTAARLPIRLVESGPAAGALAAAAHARAMGLKNVISFDMGGTTAKAALIVECQPLTAPEFEIDRRYKFHAGSGLPVRVPVIEMIEIGTGGGSIARVDALGRLQVGPESAGSAPGPAAYGRGGDKPTVTDADLILGRLGEKSFLGGDMALEIEAARNSVDADLSSLALSTEAAAAGIVAMAEETMAQAARIHAIERGVDLPDFTVFAFGGAGPVHAWGVAERLGTSEIVYPASAGVMSALGLLTAPIAFERARGLTCLLDDVDYETVNAALSALAAEALAEVEQAQPGQPSISRAVFLRYQRQIQEVRVPIRSGDALDRAAVEQLKTDFAAAYRAIYGRASEAPIEAVSWRVTASFPTPPAPFPEMAPGSGEADVAIKGQRPLWIGGEFVEVPVYDRYRLGRGHRFEGPALIEERESTVVLAGPAEAEIGDFGEIRVKRA